MEISLFPSTGVAFYYFFQSFAQILLIVINNSLIVTNSLLVVTNGLLAVSNNSPIVTNDSRVVTAI